MRILHHPSSVIEKLRLFLTVLEEGSLRRAADRLHISQSAITRQIQLLEHDLGGRILKRTSAGVRPTNGGHTLAGKARLSQPPRQNSGNLESIVHDSSCSNYVRSSLRFLRFLPMPESLTASLKQCSSCGVTQRKLIFAPPFRCSARSQTVKRGWPPVERTWA